jgi:integrase
MMARHATGQIVERQDSTGAVRRSLRFRAGGKRHTVPLGVVSRADAERELRGVMADIERGVWRSAVVAEIPADVPAPTFHEFSEMWWQLNVRQWAPKTVRDYEWKLEYHLIPFFGERLLSEITVSEVERYAAEKLGEDGGISPRSINASIGLLAQVLENAVDRDLIVRNPARGRGRKVKERPPARSYLQTAGQIAALLDAAGELDHEARGDRQHVERRAILSVLTFAGLRIGELCALRWRDVDLAAGWITIGDAKTPAGRRRIKMRGALRDGLLSMRAKLQHVEQDGYVFATRTGKRPSGDNIRARVVTAAVTRANENLTAGDLPALPERLTPHSLRRTFCSLLYALGEDPGVVMDEMGHADPGLALRIYRQAMRRGEDEKAAMRALVDGGEMAPADAERPVADVAR